MAKAVNVHSISLEPISNFDIASFYYLPREPIYRRIMQSYSNTALAYIRDYKLGSKLTNFRLMNRFLGARNANKLRNDVIKAINFLEKLSPTENYKLKLFKKRARKFYLWQKRLLAIHFDNFEGKVDTEKLWLIYGTGLHYLLDSLYHIFKTFTLTNKPIKYCVWCKGSLSYSWANTYTQLTEIFIPGMHTCLKLAQVKFVEGKI